MKHINGIRLIGIDHGYGNIKTANCCFPTGVVAGDTEPTFKQDLLVYEGRYYQIGVGHKEYMAEKSMDEDYYVLTLAAIVVLAAVLPLTAAPAEICILPSQGRSPAAQFRRVVLPEPLLPTMTVI